MINRYDPDQYETYTEHTTCPFHQANPGTPHPGCTCSVHMGSRRRPPEEIARLRAERQRAREDAILAEAEAIRTRRAGEGKR